MNEKKVETLVVGREDLTAAAQHLPAEEINRTYLPLTKAISQAKHIVFKEGEFEAVIKGPAEDGSRKTEDGSGLGVGSLGTEEAVREESQTAMYAPQEEPSTPEEECAGDEVPPAAE